MDVVQGNEKTKMATFNSPFCGGHETQGSEGGEGDLHSQFVLCDKNPGHSNFIPVQSLSMHDLPEGDRLSQVYELVKATVDLTVRVEVKMTSPDRPEYYQGTNVPYPYSKFKTRPSVRYGSGEISVYRFVDGRGYDAHGSQLGASGNKIMSRFEPRLSSTCPCVKCLDSVQPSNVWWEIIVDTAAHVVFNNHEASHTSCRLFYDGQDGPAISLDKMSVLSVDVDTDVCFLKSVTCEPLGEKLYNLSVHWQSLSREVKSIYRGRPDVRMSFIVSHPHGCPKHITVGQWTKYKVGEINPRRDRTMLTYTAGTCPGSSGARVHCLGFVGGHVHFGSSDSGVNYSGVGVSWK